MPLQFTYNVVITINIALWASEAKSRTYLPRQDVRLYLTFGLRTNHFIRLYTIQLNGGDSRKINHQDQHIAILIHPRPSNLPLYPVISCEKKIHKMKILTKNHENKTDGLVMSECQVPKAWAAALPYPWPWKKVDTKEPQHFDKLPLLPFLWPAAGKYYIQGDNKVPIEARSTHSSTFQACRTRGC